MNYDNYEPSQEFSQKMEEIRAEVAGLPKFQALSENAQKQYLYEATLKRLTNERQAVIEKWVLENCRNMTDRQTMRAIQKKFGT